MVLFEDFAVYQNSSLLSDTKSIHLANQSQLGPFSDFRQFHFLGGLNLGNKKTRGLGLAAFISQDGQLISENRFNLSYWNDIKIKSNWVLTFSTQIGLINQSLGATRSTSGISTFTPEINLGTNLRDKKNLFAISFNQGGNFEQIPISQSIIYKQFLTFLYKREIEASPSLKINLIGYSLLIQDIKNNYAGKAKFIFNDLFSFGLGMGTQGALGSLTWRKIPIGKNNLHVSFGTLAPIFNNKPIISSPFQIQLKYIAH